MQLVLIKTQVAWLPFAMSLSEVICFVVSSGLAAKLETLHILCSVMKKRFATEGELLLNPKQKL